MKNNSIKQRLLLLVCALGMAGITHAQTITAYRYWFDSAIGSATTVSVTAAQNINLTAGLATTSLSLGYHTITLQFKDATGAYSSPKTSSFVKTGSTISAYEYWWDGNYSTHVTVALTPAQSVNLATAIQPVGIDTGQHLFAIRFKDLLGNWSVPLQDTVHTNMFFAGLHELTSVNNISIFPNPTHADAILSFEGTGNEILTLTISDIMGKQIQQHNLQNDFAHQQYALNTADMAAGTYLVNISSAKGTSTRKLVVQ